MARMGGRNGQDAQAAEVQRVWQILDLGTESTKGQAMTRAEILALADHLEKLVQQEEALLRRMSAKEDVIKDWIKASGKLAECYRENSVTIIASLRAIAGDRE